MLSVFAESKSESDFVSEVCMKYGRVSFLVCEQTRHTHTYTHIHVVYLCSHIHVCVYDYRLIVESKLISNRDHFAVFLFGKICKAISSESFLFLFDRSLTPGR